MKRLIDDAPDCYPWTRVFALWPVKTIGGKYIWLKPVYKRRFWIDDAFHLEPCVEYAELFDILQECQQ